jgi:hypothetical protein
MKSVALRSRSSRIQRLWSARARAVVADQSQTPNLQLVEEHGIDGDPPQLVTSDDDDLHMSNVSLKVAAWALKRRMVEVPREWHWPLLLGKIYERLRKSFDARMMLWFYFEIAPCLFNMSIGGYSMVRARCTAGSRRVAD